MEKNRIHALPLGDSVRMSYSRINEVLEMPNLIEVQKDSYQWFLDEGLKEVFEDISPIMDFSGNLELKLTDFTLDSEPKYSIEECKERDATYAAALKVKARLYNKELDEIKEQEIFMGDFPLMTETGTFIINGAERVIVSQLVRSPGIYYASDFDKVGKKLLSATVIPNRGACQKRRVHTMAHVISDECVSCGSCEGECPVGAISEGAKNRGREERHEGFGDQPRGNFHEGLRL